MKKSFALLMVVMMLTVNFSFADIYEPVIGLQSDLKTQTVNAGEKIKLEIPIENAGWLSAHSVKVTLTGDHPFKSYASDLTEVVGELKPYVEKNIVFDVEVNPTAKSQYYEVEVLFEYSNSSSTSYSSTDKLIVKVENKNIEPTLGVISYHSGYDAIKANVDDGIAIFVGNKGTVSAKDIRVTLSGFSDTGIVLDQDVDTKSIYELGAGEKKLISYKIRAGISATTQTVPIEANIVYIDDYGNEYEKTSMLYFKVEGFDTSGADIEIQNLKYPETLAANQTFNVDFDVANTGNVTMDIAEISIDYPDDFVAKTSAKKVIKNLKPGEIQTMSVTLMTKPEMSSQNYDAWANVAYHVEGDSSEDKETIQEYISFFVDEMVASSKPKLIIDNYDYGGEYVYAGENYELNLYIKNTSTTERTQNIKVTLSSEENVFTPVDSSSSFYIDRIGQNEVYKHTVNLKTKIDASVKIYPLTVKMEYEDGSGNAYDATEVPYAETELLSIAVAQPVRLELADIIVPYEVYAGEAFYIEQEFYNMGKSTMYNMMVKMEGPESMEASYFIGNFESGSSNYYSAQAYAYEEGEFEGKLIYSFEDALGNTSTKEVPFSYTVMPAMDYEDENFYGEEMYPEEMPAEENGSLPLFIGIGVGILLLVGVIVHRRRKKARAAMEALEDEES